MGDVKKSQYRQPLTPKGIEKMEKGTLNWFDPEMFANFNTGTLEQYLDEKNAREGFEWDKWVWWKVIVAIFIGCLFALINQYVGLKVGMVVGGSWYMLYLMGLALKWSAPELNTAATASNGAAMICVGFVFTFPAILLLWKHDIGLVDGGRIITGLSPMVVAVAIAATSLSGILGVMYFIVFRRIWLVEDPLPTPGFEAMTKLLDMSHHLSRGSTKEAKKSIKLVGITIIGTMFFTFLRDFPLFNGGPGYHGETVSTMDKFFGGKYFHYGEVHQTFESSKYTHFAFAFIPIQLGIGWFMKFKTALLIFMGTAFTWFVVIPLVVLMRVPIYNGSIGGYVTAIAFADAKTATDIAEALRYGFDPVASPSWGAAFTAYNIARLIAIGCILGGGITAIVKMAPVFFTVFKDMKNIGKPGVGGGTVKAAYYPKKGWYEWPSSHIKWMIIVNFVGVSLIFIVGGFNPLYSIIFSIMLASCTFFLGAIAVKVMGETGTEPVSATSFIVLLFIIVVFLGISALMRSIGLDFMAMDKSEIAIMALIGVTVFGGAISMSGDVIMNFKNGLYAGNRPYHLVKANTLGIPLGAVVAGVSAYILSYGLAVGELNLQAPQAFAFVIFTKAIISLEIQWPILIFGILLGVFLELLMGLGTAFGLGMYLPLGINAPMLVGGASRDLWEKYYLAPTVKKKGWGESERTLKLMETYMIATGLMVGEALMGTVVALYLVVPLLTGGGA